MPHVLDTISDSVNSLREQAAKTVEPFDPLTAGLLRANNNLEADPKARAVGGAVAAYYTLGAAGAAAGASEGAGAAASSGAAASESAAAASEAAAATEGIGVAETGATGVVGGGTLGTPMVVGPDLVTTPGVATSAGITEGVDTTAPTAQNAATSEAGKTAGKTATDSGWLKFGEQTAATSLITQLLTPKPKYPSAPTTAAAPVTPIPDPLAQEQARKQSLIAQIARRGRTSTILTDTATGGGRVGG